MKKMLLILLIVLLTFSLLSCNNSQETNESLLNSIYEIDSGSYNVEKAFNHKNLIYNEIEHSFDEKAQATKTVKIIDQNCELKYEDTISYPVGGHIFNRYLVDGNEEKNVLLNSDGSIASVLYDFVTLDIEKSSLPGEILPSLKEELNKIIDIYRYKHVQISEVPSDIENGFGIYDYVFYNELDGYVTDYTMVSVSDNGNVMGLRVFDFDEKELPTNIDIDNELMEKMLETKLKDIYSTEETEYVAYEGFSMPRLVTYEGEVFVRYSASVKYDHITYGMMSSYIVHILIPVAEKV